MDPMAIATASNPRDGFATIRACSTKCYVPPGMEEMVVDVYRMQNRAPVKSRGSVTSNAGVAEAAFEAYVRAHWLIPCLLFYGTPLSARLALRLYFSSWLPHHDISLNPIVLQPVKPHGTIWWQLGERVQAIMGDNNQHKCTSWNYRQKPKWSENGESISDSSINPQKYTTISSIFISMCHKLTAFNHRFKPSFYIICNKLVHTSALYVYFLPVSKSQSWFLSTLLFFCSVL